MATALPDAAAGDAPAVPFFQMVQAQIERQLVAGTLRRREIHRLDQIPDIDVPLFEFERVRAEGRSQQRRKEETDMMNTACGKGTLALKETSAKTVRRRFSIRSWKSLASEAPVAAATGAKSSDMMSISEEKDSDEEELENNHVQSPAEERERAKTNPIVKRTADIFWFASPRDLSAGILQKDYCEMYIRMLRTLYESFNEDTANLITRRQWASIAPAPPARGINRDQMRQAMLDTADAWVVSYDSMAYITFFKTLLYRIVCAKQGTNSFRWREMDQVCQSLDETRRPFEMALLPDYVQIFTAKPVKAGPKPRPAALLRNDVKGVDERDQVLSNGNDGDDAAANEASIEDMIEDDRLPSPRPEADQSTPSGAAAVKVIDKGVDTASSKAKLDSPVVQVTSRAPIAPLPLVMKAPKASPRRHMNNTMSGTSLSLKSPNQRSKVSSSTLPTAKTYSTAIKIDAAPRKRGSIDDLDIHLLEEKQRKVNRDDGANNIMYRFEERQLPPLSPDPKPQQKPMTKGAGFSMRADRRPSRDEMWLQLKVAREQKARVAAKSGIILPRLQ